MVDLLLGSVSGAAVGARIEGVALDAPAHFDAEVLSALGRLERARQVSAAFAGRCLEVLAEAPVDRHPLPGLIEAAWRRRKHLRLVDALYVELAVRLDAPLLTTDAALARATDRAELIA